MKHRRQPPSVTICVLTFGDHAALAQRCLESIQRFCRRPQYQLIVGANAVGAETEGYLKALRRAKAIDHLVSGRRNLHKCPMMRRMLARVDTEFIWWFDDDSHLTKPGTFSRLLRIARRSPPTTVLWGASYVCSEPATSAAMPDLVAFVRSAKWYRGLTPPSWRPGGKGEFNLDGRGIGDGRWFFVTGGCWLARTQALRELDWPDPRLIILNEDILLCEAIRQRGWLWRSVSTAGLAINDARRRRATPPGTARALA